MFIMGGFFFLSFPSVFFGCSVFFFLGEPCEIEQKKLISPAGLFKISTLSPKFLFLHVFPVLAPSHISGHIWLEERDALQRRKIMDRGWHFLFCFFSNIFCCLLYPKVWVK